METSDGRATRAYSTGRLSLRPLTTTTETIVNGIARALASNQRLNTLCNAALLRTTRSALLHHLLIALDTLGRAAQKHAESPVEKATAWILRGYKSAIALRTFELISPEDYTHASSPSKIDPNAVARHVIQEQRLKQLLKDKFPWIEQHRHGSFQISELPADDDRSQILGRDDDLGYPPDLQPLSTSSHVQQIFSSGPVFDLLYKKLKNDVFPSACTTIDKVLQNYILDDERSTSIALTVEWQLLEYLEHEAISVKDLDSVFTITGELDSACAFRLGDYLSKAWDTGNEMLEVVRELVRIFNESKSEDTEEKGLATSKKKLLAASSSDMYIRLFPASGVAPEQAYVQITGTFDHLQERIEQLAWLTATLRLHLEGQLTISDTKFRAQQVLIANSLESYSQSTVFHLSLFDQTKVFNSESKQPGQCWTSAFSESVLAYGFPILGSNRPNGALGLEVPFNIMTAFVGVKYPILLKDRTVFAGNSNLLTPEKKLDDNCIQWHFQRDQNWIDQAIATQSKDWDSRLETPNVSSLVTSRAFLGYSGRMEVLLGTVENKYVDIPESEVPRTSKAGFHPPKDPLQVDLDDHGSAVAVDGATWKFNRGEAALMRTSSSSFDERLRQAAKKPVLLYCQDSSIAFLVPGLSCVLQMVISCLWKESQLKRTDIPIASITADGNDAAYRAIKKAEDMIVPFLDGRSRRYRDVVESYLDIIEQRETQSSVWRQFDKTSPNAGSGFLRGWDYADIQAKRHEVWERERATDDTTTDQPPTWWKLFQQQASSSTTTTTTTGTTTGTGALVLFTKMTKMPIRASTMDDGHFNCRAWDAVPRDRHVLLASVSQLDLLRTNLGTDHRRRPARYMLSDTVAWARPVGSRLFDSGDGSCADGTTCTPVQGMLDLNSTLPVPSGSTSTRQQYLSWPGRVEHEGAVLFAPHDPAAFEPRPCWSRPHPKMQRPVDRGRLFIGASLAAFALVYWNFYFFSFSMAVFGLAYTLS